LRRKFKDTIARENQTEEEKKYRIDVNVIVILDSRSEMILKILTLPVRHIGARKLC
jgi:hypothetical protein